MLQFKIFISSVQKEFAKEREALYKHFVTDPLLSTFFTPILFERLPAASQSPNKVYLKEVAGADIYLGLLGAEYGYEDNAGVSPTEHEYDHATANGLERWIFIKGGNELKRHRKEEAFIRKVGDDVSRKRFNTTEELLQEVSRSCMAYLQQKGLVAATSFDASIHPTATLRDIDKAKLKAFVRSARSKRSFPLKETATPAEVLTHLNMLQDDRLTNSALLAFGKKPQQFFPSAILKCAHFHGREVQKPIPDHKVYQGDVFEQVDQAVDFVLSKINVSVGTRDTSVQAPVNYEIPRAAVTEGIVNAVAHRDYNSNGSVQVMLFADRLEITNPGRLAPELSLAKLKKQHGSYPTNPHLAECMYQTGYIERFGTGTLEMIRLSTEARLQEPEFDIDEGFKVVLWRPGASTVHEGVYDTVHDADTGQEPTRHRSSTDQVTDQVTGEVPEKYRRSTDQATDQVTGQVPGKYRSSTDPVTDQVTDQVDELIKRLVMVISRPQSRSELMAMLDMRHIPNFRDNYLNPSIEQGFVEMTDPGSPNSPRQRYRLTGKGEALKKSLRQKP